MTSKAIDTVVANAEPLFTGQSFDWYAIEELPQPQSLPKCIFIKLTEGTLLSLMGIRQYKSKTEAMKDLRRATEAAK